MAASALIQGARPAARALVKFPKVPSSNTNKHSTFDHNRKITSPYFRTPVLLRTPVPSKL
jgi:hypothetical protein